MDEVLKNLSSVSWWVGIVFVGLAINIIAAYLKPHLDGTLSSLSKRWAAISSKRRGEREARINKLAASEHEQLLNRTEELRFRIRSFGYIFEAIALLGIAVWLQSLLVPDVLLAIISIALALFALILLLVASDDWRLAIRNKQELDEARDRHSSP